MKPDTRHAWLQFASEICREHLQVGPIRVERFTTGLSLFVFDVWLEDGQRRVIRIAPESRKDELESGIHWHKELTKLNCPLPKLYTSGTYKDHGFAIYERLAGSDLEEIHDELTIKQIRGIAEGVAEAQKIVGKLDPCLFPTSGSCRGMVEGVLARSKRGFQANRLFDTHYLHELNILIKQEDGYFGSVSPTPFLYDLNIRNVIVYQGKMSGIVDVDEVACGDPLLAIGRGKMLHLWMGRKLELVTHWIEYLKLNEQQRRAVDIYALLYCIRSMSVLGGSLNGNVNIQTDTGKSRELIETTDKLLTSIRS